MPPLKYHQGQLSIQEEAKTTIVAARLADWVGPVVEFALGAEVFLLALERDGELRFTVLSGRPPLLEVEGQSQRRHSAGESEESPLLRFPASLVPAPQVPVPCGGLAISLATSRRARLNGLLRASGDATELVTEETFTLCRKYIAGAALSEGAALVEGTARRGPVARRPLSLGDPWLRDLLAKTETAFLATISPTGAPDVAHRGGPPGFLQLDPASGVLRWPEYVGDGVFKSAGNLRASRRFTLLVPELETGEGVELAGRGDYTNLRDERRQRLDPLVQHREQYPIQGAITCRVEAAYRLEGLMLPHRRLAGSGRVTSASSVDEQAPR